MTVDGFKTDLSLFRSKILATDSADPNLTVRTMARAYPPTVVFEAPNRFGLVRFRLKTVGG